MDFFQHQEQARKHTFRLVLFFGLAVLSIIALTYAAVTIAVIAISQGEANTAFNPVVILAVSAGVIGVVVCAILYKLAALRRGGAAVAEMLNGQLILRSTQDNDERKILNIVDEMAIAAGTPVPPVYLIDNNGINAFAAGYAVDDAVIGITRGAIRKLSRDELQGVLAHEFSHILNGDMRLNLRLMAIIFGILAIGFCGQMLMRVMAHSGHRRSHSSNKKGGGAAILVLLGLGLALLIIGYVGVFFANCIKAAVSRQREYLADAAAVQFTRNPDGIGNALMKIGSYGCAVHTAEASEISHMFFAEGVSNFFGSALATHPPLPQRILRVLPDWDGVFPEAKEHKFAVEGEEAFQLEQKRREDERKQRAEKMLGVLTAGAAIETGSPAAGSSALQSVGTATQTHADYARILLQAIPPEIRDAAAEPYGCRAVIYAFLLDQDPAQQDFQQQLLESYANPVVTELTLKLVRQLARLPQEMRLPIIELCIPTLYELSQPQYDTFLDVVDRLIEADDKTTVREWVIRNLVRRPYDILYHGIQLFPGQSKLRDLKPQAIQLLSMLAHFGADSPQDAQNAFDAAASELGFDDTTTILPKLQCTLESFDPMIEALANLRALEIRRLLGACANVITHDKQVTVTEGELLRVVADALGVPMPPILPGQRLN